MTGPDASLAASLGSADLLPALSTYVCDGEGGGGGTGGEVEAWWLATCDGLLTLPVSSRDVGRGCVGWEGDETGVLGGKERNLGVGGSDGGVGVGSEGQGLCS